MTGCYPKRVLPIPHVLFPGNNVGLSPREVTVAEVLKAVGYATAIVGKWHLGDQPEFLPNKQGFDLHFGLPYSNDMGPAEDGVKSDLGKPLPKPKGPGQPPLPLLRNGVVVKRVLPDGQQALLELYTDEAVKFIAANRSGPFFLYLAPNAVHFPVYPGKKWAGKSPHGIFSSPARSGPGNRHTASSPTGSRKWTGAWARSSMRLASTACRTAPWSCSPATTAGRREA